MPARSRRPQSTPAGPARSAPQAGPQATVGNAALAAGVGIGGVEDTQSLLRDKTEGASISAGGRLPGGLKLGEKDGNVLSTGEATGFDVGVGRHGLWASFHPGIQVQPGNLLARAATGGITITRLNYDFARGAANLELDTGITGDFLDVFMGLKGTIEERFGTALKGALPARLQQPGYDPYSDPDLPGLLRQVVTTMGSAFPKAPGAPKDDLTEKVSQPTLSVSVRPKATEIALDGGMKVIVDPGSSLTLTAHLEGNLDDALSQPRVSRLDVRSDGIEVQNETGGKLASIDIRSLSFGPDLSLQRFDYDLAVEDALSAFKAIGILLQLRTGQDLGIRDANAVRLDPIRRLIDDKAKAQLPEMLREQVRAHDGAIPGFQLTKMFRGL